MTVLDEQTAAPAAMVRPLRWVELAMSGAPIGPSDEFALPIGTVTFLLTDIEGSTKAWAAAPHLMGPAVARHYELLDSAVAAYGGVRPQEQGEGDSIVAAFSRSSDALRAAVAAQRALTDEAWVDGTPAIRVRMAVHTGEAQLRNEANYVGQAIIRTARLRAIAHGGQIIASQAARDLAIDQLGHEIALVDLGTHQLKDLARPEHVWQVVVPGRDDEFPPLNSLDAVPNNLPTALSTFIGRQGEIDAVVLLATSNRLVTINGSGGAGKTRLAQQVAAQIADRFADGAWWIDLAPLTGDDVARTTSTVLSIKDPAALVERLATRQTLLVFDNCEHVLGATAPLIADIMRRCPSVRVIATSRRPLDVSGEVTWRVPPLTLPTPDHAVPLERLAQYDAVRLFVDRARKARPNFTLTNANGPSVAEICTRLDGLPLAIELAAARAKSLTPQQILAGLEHSLRLLTGGSKLVLPRQQTLEASIAWSHELLDQSERVVLRRVSVFADGWDLEAAEAVCADETVDQMQILDSLERLIDQSLITASDEGDEVRYRALETVRQFGTARLAEIGEADEIGRRHAAHYVHLAREWAPRCEGPDEVFALAKLNPEHPNFGAVLRRLHAADDALGYARAVLTLTPVWAIETRHAVDGVAAMTRALDLVGDSDPAIKVALLQARAECRTTLGLIALSYFDAMECVTLADAAGTDVPIGRALALAGASHSTIDRKEGAAFLVRAENELARVGDEFGQLILASRRSTMAALGDPRVAGPVLEANRTAALRLGNPRQIFDWSMWAAMRSGILGDHATGRAAMELGLRVKPSSPDGQALLQCFDFMAAGPNKAGPTSDDLAKTHASLQRQEVGWMAVLVQTVRAHALIREGQYTEGRALADANLDILMVPGKNVLNIIISALCSIALGEFDRAEATYATIGDLASWTDSILGSAEVSAHLALHHNDPTAAEVSMRRALALATKQGYRRETIGALEMLAVIATRRGAWVDAARLIGAAEHHRDLWDLTAHLDPLATRLRASREAIDANLDADARAVALEAGAALTLEGVVEYVNRAHNERDRATVGWDALTPTERRVADLVRSGMSNAETAKELLMGAETVKTHLSRVFTKLGVANRTKLAALPPSPD